MSAHARGSTVGSGPDLPERERHAIDDLVRRLQVRFDGQDPEHVRSVVHQHLDHLGDARVRTYVPVLVEHAARDTLEGARR